MIKRYAVRSQKRSRNATYTAGPSYKRRISTLRHRSDRYDRHHDDVIGSRNSVFPPGPERALCRPVKTQICNI